MFSASFEDDESNKKLVLIAMLENILGICVLFLLHCTKQKSPSTIPK